MIENIFKAIDSNVPLSFEDAMTLLSIENLSLEYYNLLQKANEISRRDFSNKGYIFAQIGLNIAPCSGNCLFCSLAECNSTFVDSYEKTLDEILKEVSLIDFSRVTAVFLMTTADYDLDKFLKIGSEVRQIIPKKIALVANTGDFDLSYARQLKSVGFTGAYHIVRLREGIDTAISPDKRIVTLNAIYESGLRLYYCLEPIGPEHTYEEMVREMIRARDYKVDVMAAMRRVNVEGTPFANQDIVDDFEMAKIVAVTRLVTMPKISMNVHEPFSTGMLAGVNQLYVEMGANPRDNAMKTEDNRAFNTNEVSKMLLSAGYCPYIEDITSINKKGY